MAKATVELVRALRLTAQRLREGAAYQWGHFGACNCGHLAQTLTRRSSAEIHRLALQQRALDWGDEAQQFVAAEACSSSRLPFDLVVDELLAVGLTTDDLHRLERLEDAAVLARLPGGLRWLQRNDRDDAVAYFEAWARLLEEQLFVGGRPVEAIQPASRTETHASRAA